MQPQESVLIVDAVVGDVTGEEAVVLTPEIWAHIWSGSQVPQMLGGTLALPSGMVFHVRATLDPESAHQERVTVARDADVDAPKRPPWSAEHHAVPFDYRNNLPVVVDLRQTCPACPAQWEGVFADGRELYVRYRHGALSARFGVRGAEFFNQVDGDANAGEISEAEMLRRVGLRTEAIAADDEARAAWLAEIKAGFAARDQARGY